MTKDASVARRVATEVLRRVAADGAYASRALDAEIRAAALDKRDSGLATEIVYGTLRALPAVDRALDAHLQQPNKVDPYLRAAMRAGAYQLLHLGRVPVHAAVSDAVTLVRETRGKRLSGVANAVLRKVAAERPDDPHPPDRVVLPKWLVKIIARSLGPEQHEAFLGARRMPPPTGLRASGDPVALASAIRAAHPEAEVMLSTLVSRAVSVRGAGDPRRLPGYDDGKFSVQELGSQYVTELLGVALGDRVADLCCGHGTKTLSFAQRGATVVAVDLYERKLERLVAERARLQIPDDQVEVLAADLTVGLGGLEEGSFDRVLLDAPCTGLGTILRRPELLLRLEYADIARLAALQSQLLENAWRLVRPGGTLVYAVCSPTSEEGQKVSAQLNSAETTLVGPWLGEEFDCYFTARWTNSA